MSDVCEHGGLRRQCIICELIEERDQLRVMLAATCVTRLTPDWRPTRAYLRDGSVVRAETNGHQVWLEVEPRDYAQGSKQGDEQ